MVKTEKTVINYSVEVCTKEMIGEICQITKRGPGNVIDWAVAEAYNNIMAIAREKTPLGAVLEEASVSSATE